MINILKIVILKSKLSDVLVFHINLIWLFVPTCIVYYKNDYSNLGNYIRTLLFNQAIKIIFQLFFSILASFRAI